MYDTSKYIDIVYDEYVKRLASHPDVFLHLTFVKYWPYRYPDKPIVTVREFFLDGIDTPIDLTQFRFQLVNASDISNNLAVSGRTLIKNHDTNDEKTYRLRVFEPQEMLKPILTSANLDEYIAKLCAVIAMYIGYNIHETRFDIYNTSTVPTTDIHSINELSFLYKKLNTKETFCNYCARSSMQSNLMRCSECLTTLYCSRKCQLLDFNKHKTTCNM
jgi:uncharacterized short protein YbdD (DUF466 family)